MANKPYYIPASEVPLPPPDADEFTTCCDYCVVACGYKVYRWPLKGKSGGPKASENALGVDFPRGPLKGGWISPNMHNVVTANGKKQNVVVVPDKDSKVVNRNGAHSIRGGCIAQKVYNPDTPTRDRLQYPQMRVNGKLERISWDDATDIFAEMANYVIEKYSENAYAQKQYSYQYFENNYALTKLALRHINTPAHAYHDNPGHAPDTPGFRDAGIDNFSACYDDWYEADVVFLSGTDPFETKTIIWNEYMLRGSMEHGQKQIFVNPRRTPGVDYAVKHGGLHLQLIPGSDTILHMALARIILENGWQDKEWLAEFPPANHWESNSGFGRGIRDTPWQWRTTWGKVQTKGFDDYKKWILSQKESELDFAAKTCGLPKEQIIKAAEMMAKPRPDGTRPKLSVAIEKGNYWTNNYSNTASIASLGLICGAGNRPGQMISRLGGHQRGGNSGGSYPRSKGPEKFFGRRRMQLNLDKWLENGHVRMAYVVGTTWIGAMSASQSLQASITKATRGNPHQITRNQKAHAIEMMKRRVDSGGTLIVNQDIYLREPIGSELADFVFPAAAWGEETFVRSNGERRMRIYDKFYDAPGESKPDWWIVGQIGQKMGFPGFDWKSSNDVYEESMRGNRRGRRDYAVFLKYAKKAGKTGHDFLRELGTQGIQTPVREVDGKIVGTKRFHDSTLELPKTGPEALTWMHKTFKSFKTQTGRPHLLKSPWFIFADFYDAIKPKGDELWVSSGRMNEVWQSGFDDVQRRPYIIQRWPENILEIHPEDAKARGIESGDVVEAYSDRVAVQTGGFIHRTLEDSMYTGLVKNGHIEFKSASVELVAMVTDTVRKGATFSICLMNPKRSVNALSPSVTDPMSGNYRFKLGVGKVRKIGESPYKEDFAQMTFTDRTFG
ncbi:MAG: arsenate reductase (azurin) large subunit [bacterium]|nr:arsenate reductase (azurin) large subunit [bacterium]